MGNSFSNVACNADDVLPNYDPRDEINTPENKLKLIPFIYTNSGLYHDYDTLARIYPEIIFFTIEEQANYSDAITRRYALNQHFVNRMSGGLNMTIEEFADKANTTAIGNIAFMAIHQGLESRWGIYHRDLINYLKNNKR